jgi:hypothetical protein
MMTASSQTAVIAEIGIVPAMAVETGAEIGREENAHQTAAVVRRWTVKMA